MTIQQIIIILMVVLFATGVLIGHAIGYARRRDQIKALQAQIRVMRQVMRASDDNVTDLGRRR